MSSEQMLSYTAGAAETPLRGETLWQSCGAAVRARGDGEALVDCASGRRWTYAELAADVDRLAAGLLERGIGRRDVVGLWAQNVPEWVIVQYALARIGAVLVNINPAYRTHELAYVLEQSGARLLITQAAAPPHSDFLALGREAVAEVVSTRGTPLDIVVLDTVPGALGEPAGRLDDFERLSTLLARGDALLADPGARMGTRLEQASAELDRDDPINIQYTSGTTGFPKGVTLTHHGLLNNGHSIGDLLGYGHDDAVVLPVPYFHCFGMVIGTIAVVAHGARAVIPSAAFDPAAALRAVAAERATSLYGVPTMFIAELALPDFSDYDLTSLRTGVMAGSTCPVEVMRRVIDEMHMSEVAICYGMTETSPVSTMTRADDSLARRTETVGRVMPHLEIKIVDPYTGQTVPRGVTGELRTRGYSVMRGYWRDAEKTAEAVDEAGWMRTGDLAAMDADGYVEITGRIKDMVIRGGENIYPREIEEFLYRHPAIRDVQVVGVPDEKYGEELMAWVVLSDPQGSLTAEDVREYCSGTLAHYKIPRYVEVCEEFPLTVSGKIRKVELREAGAKIVGGEAS